MAIQTREILEKTEKLMEQGTEAERNVSSCKTQMSQAQRNVQVAMMELAEAQETDEDGNPTGDVQAAQAKVQVAQNQYAASQRALDDAERHLESVNENKKSLAGEIKSHNDVERSNLSKLEALKKMAFAENSDGLSEGIAERLNETEDARARLLASLGINEGAEHARGGGAGSTGSLWSLDISDGLDTSGHADGVHGAGGGTGGSHRIKLALDPDGASGTGGSEDGTNNDSPGESKTEPKKFKFAPGTFISMPSDFNGHPSADTRDAFEFYNAYYDRSSSEWQEAGFRHVENLNGRIAENERRTTDAKQREKAAISRMNDYLSNGLHSVNDPGYDAMHYEYVECQNEIDRLEKERKSLIAMRDDISSSLDPARRTTFRGRDGSDFASAYDGIITSRQGKSVAGFSGTCGINEECSVTNQLLGTSYGEKYGIDYAIANHLCFTGGEPKKNGGTNWRDRAAFLTAHGLTFSRVEGKRDTGVPISLDDMAAKFNSGYRGGIMLKGSDLGPPEYAKERRKYKLGNPEHNKKRFNANHATTIAGFSYYDSGEVAGVWINDTGGMTGCNRVYISRERFDEMQRITSGFAVEWSRVRTAAESAPVFGKRIEFSKIGE